MIALIHLWWSYYYYGKNLGQGNTYHIDLVTFMFFFLGTRHVCVHPVCSNVNLWWNLKWRWRPLKRFQWNPGKPVIFLSSLIEDSDVKQLLVQSTDCYTTSTHVLNFLKAFWLNYILINRIHYTHNIFQYLSS